MYFSIRYIFSHLNFSSTILVFNVFGEKELFLLLELD